MEKETDGKRLFAGKPGPGRPKGIPNKNTTRLKDAILDAAEKAGGKGGLLGYLTKQADANPVAFMSLLGKVLPMTVAGDDESPLRLIVERRLVRPE